MDIRYLEDFIELVQCASFTDAARRVNISQSALSKRIKAMESELGVELLERGGREVRPTPEGRVLLAASIDIVNRYRDAGNALRRMRSRPLVRVGGTLHDPFVSSLLDRLDRHEAPYAIERRDQPFDLLGTPFDADELDVLFAPMSSGDRLHGTPFTAKLVKRDQAVAVVSQDDPLAARGHVSLRELAGHLFIRIVDNHASDDGWRAIEAMCSGSGFVPKIMPCPPELFSLPQNAAFLLPQSRIPSTARSIANADASAIVTIDDASFDLFMISPLDPDGAALRAFVDDAAAIAQAEDAEPLCETR